MMENKTTDSLLVNVFALPNQSNLIFVVIVLVLLGSVTLGSLGAAPVPFWPATIVILLLSIRSFLTYPDKKISHDQLTRTGKDQSMVIDAISNLCKGLEMRRVPELLISSSTKPGILYTFGSFRRWFIVISAGEAAQLQTELAEDETRSTAHARLIHELQHFKNGDNWRMGYCEALLRTTFLFMTWMLALFLGYILLLMVAVRDIFSMDFSTVASQVHNISPELDFLANLLVSIENDTALIRAKVFQIDLSLVMNYVMSATMPYILISIVLLLVFFRKLWRLRELYADAGVVHFMGEFKSFISALTGIPRTFLFDTWDEGEKADHIPVQKKLPTSLKSLFTTFSDWLKRMGKWHPSNEERLACATNPTLIYDSWIEMTLLLGSLLLLLDIIMASPLVLIYTGTLPMHFTVLSVICFVSFSLAPGIVNQTQAVSNALKAISLVSIIRFAWLSVTLAFMFLFCAAAPDTFADVMGDVTASVARYAGSAPVEIGNLGTFLVEATISNLAQVMVIFLVSSLAVAGNGALLARIFRWYAFPNASKNLLRIIYVVIGVSMLFWGAGILLPLTLIFSASLQSSIGFVLIVTILAWLLTSIALALFVWADRKYSNHCPYCGKILSEVFALKTPCSQCQKLPLSWLLIGDCI